MIHVAGTPIAIGSLRRQLCCWCGAVLINDDISTIMVADGEAYGGAFSVGALVRVEGNGSYVESILSDGPLAFADMPVGWCGQPANVIAISRRDRQ